MTAGSNDSIADALRGLNTGDADANIEQPQQPAPASPKPQHHEDDEEVFDAVIADDDDDEQAFEAAIDGEVDDESGEVIGAAPGDVADASTAAAASSPATTSARPRPGRKARSRHGSKQTNPLKAIGAPILITVGLLMLIPGIWSVLYLMGSVTSTKDNADLMAYVMLSCWPIAAILVASGIFFAVQVHREKQASQKK
jgi:hypothetical protein